MTVLLFLKISYRDHEQMTGLRVGPALIMKMNRMAFFRDGRTPKKQKIMVKL